jgi:hypothetical protein
MDRQQARALLESRGYAVTANGGLRNDVNFMYWNGASPFMAEVVLDGHFPADELAAIAVWCDPNRNEQAFREWGERAKAALEEAGVDTTQNIQVLP